MKGRRLRGICVGYGVAVVALACCSGLRLALPEALDAAPYLGFYPAVVISAATGGLGPGLVATFGSLALVTTVFGHLDPHDHNSLARQAIWVVASLGVSLLAARQRTARARERQQARALQRANADLDQFAHAASHDLQENQRMVTTFLDLLRQRSRDRLDARAEECIGFAEQGAMRMSHMLGDLLAYVHAGTTAGPRRFALREAMDEACGRLQVEMAAHGARVTHDELPSLTAGRAGIVQVIEHLIGNAIKFRRAGVAPHIHVRAARHEDEWIVSVRDNGIGIPKSQALRLFQVFERLHERERYPGNGIGLAICKRIVESQGGRMWVESVEGEGTTFLFALPVRPLRGMRGAPQGYDSRFASDEEDRA